MNKNQKTMQIWENFRKKLLNDSLGENDFTDERVKPKNNAAVIVGCIICV